MNDVRVVINDTEGKILTYSNAYIAYNNDDNVLWISSREDNNTLAVFPLNMVKYAEVTSIVV